VARVFLVVRLGAGNSNCAWPEDRQRKDGDSDNPDGRSFH
jgi:hypothetical protein